jgi:hypothetical protein
MANTCEKYLKEVSTFIDKLNNAEIDRFCDKPDALVEYIITKYIGSLGYLSPTRAAWGMMKTSTKDKYIKTIKILFWKLHNDTKFIEGCREHRLEDIKTIFKETLISAQGYISPCAGKQYTYKHKNSNVDRYNSGLKPEVEPVVVPTNRNKRSLSRTTYRSNDNKMQTIKSFLLKKTKKIRKNKENLLSKIQDEEDELEKLESSINFRPLTFRENKLTKLRAVSPRFAVARGPVTRSQTASMRSQAPPPSKRRNTTLKKTRS